MKESLATFRKAVNESADLQEKLKGGTDLVELGKENGYDFSQEDVTAAFEELWRSGEPWLNSMEAESGGSGSGSSGGSFGWLLVAAAVCCVCGVFCFSAEDESGFFSFSSLGVAFWWLGGLLVAAAVAVAVRKFFLSKKK